MGPGANTLARVRSEEAMERSDTAGLHVLERGRGPAVVLVHGSISRGETTWRPQAELAARWRLRIADRPGFGSSPDRGRGDFETEAPLFAELLGEGAHLVGHSYGAVIALYAAALRPHAVRSLTTSEPGCMRVAAGVGAVDRQLANGELLYARAGELQPRDFLLAFRGGAGVTRETPPRLDAELERGVRRLMEERPPWEAEPAWEALRAAPFPKLVISGGHSEVFEAVCDAAAARLAADRRTVPGRGHTVTAAAGYNEVLERFLVEAEATGERRRAAGA
jgi:pimeloyl-ACP methyl ester carboxylesterase